LGVLFYAFLAGFEPSIVRAAAMAIIAFGAALFRRQYFAFVSLFFTGYVMLFYRPSNIFDIGFQLSFLSTFGILGIKPLLPLQKYFLVEGVSTTLAAQLTTFPVLFGVFGPNTAHCLF
jgi:competence protein ComEC